jgi:hypothetical protein
MNGPKAGDTVRLSLEGVVWLSDAGIKCITVSNGVGNFHIGIPGFPVEVTARATPPEPTEIGAMVGVDLDAGPDDALVAIRRTDARFSESWEISGFEGLCAWGYFVTPNNTVTILAPGGEV